MLPLLAKHKPKLAEIIGQRDSIAALKQFVLNFKKQKRKAAFCHGPPGTGKTATVHALAADLGLELIEINASDSRNAEQIESLIGAAAKQMSLFSKGKIILVDEIDGISGQQDRGGIPALVRVIEQTAFPIICTANDPYDQKFSALRSKCEMIAFSPLRYSDVAALLKRIAAAESIAVSQEILDTLGRRCGGDARAAINDLETLSSGKESIERKDLEMLGIREQEQSIPAALVRIFKTTDPAIAITALDAVDEDLDKVFLWIDENLPKEYTKPADLARAYDYLSRADVFNRRIRRWQHWRFLVYINAFLTAGVAVSKDAKYQTFTPYKPTMRLLKIWQANQRYAQRKDIAEKIAAKTHTSRKRVIQDVLPYLRHTFKKGNPMGKALAEEFELSSEDMEWMATWSS